MAESGAEALAAEALGEGRRGCRCRRGRRHALAREARQPRGRLELLGMAWSWGYGCGSMGSMGVEVTPWGGRSLEFVLEFQRWSLGSLGPSI